MEFQTWKQSTTNPEVFYTVSMKRKGSFAKKTPPAKKSKTVAQQNQNALAALAREIGYFDAAIATDATTTPAVIQLNNMAAGDTNLTRDGNKIGMIASQLRIAYSLESTTINARIRWVVVLDKQSNAGAATWTDVFDTALIESQRLVASLSRFEILMDKVTTLNSTSPTVTTLQKGFFKKYLKMPNTIAAYASGAGATPYTNGLSLMYISDIPAGATDVDVNGTNRLFFNR